MDDQSITVVSFGVMDQGVRARKSIRMLFASIFDVDAHHLATVSGHAARSHSRVMAARGSIAEGQEFFNEGSFLPFGLW